MADLRTTKPFGRTEDCLGVGRVDCRGVVNDCLGVVEVDDCLGVVNVDCRGVVVGRGVTTKAEEEEVARGVALEALGVRLEVLGVVTERVRDVRLVEEEDATIPDVAAAGVEPETDNRDVDTNGLVAVGDFESRGDN
jgi:hypothetical protein